MDHTVATEHLIIPDITQGMDPTQASLLAVFITTSTTTTTGNMDIK